ncbi:hypothetical protein [Bacillus subtilis]|uniref:hypothetical protein n=1 Tax=Bacillus subtilis TaxID=1423 RepID=UPI003981AF63
MTDNKNLRLHGEVITWDMTEEERLEYIKKHPIIPTEEPQTKLQVSPMNDWM